MKLSYKQIEPFITNPDKNIRVILIYGPDQGLMKERAKTIGKTVVADLNDPFNAVVLSTDIINDDPARLSDEANAISMLGGMRLIRIEKSGDKLTQALKTYLENPNDNALIILEAEELSPRSSLRKLCEKEKLAVALPCYVDDEQGVIRIIRQTCQDNGKNINNDATQWLATNISGDRAKIRGELEKIILYKGPEQNPITLEDVQKICGQAGAQGLDNLVYAVASQKPNDALKAYNTLLEEGVNSIAILRSLQNHFRRLHLTKSKMQEGTNIEKAMKTLSPPIFFKQESAFKSQIHNWPLAALAAAMSKLVETEGQTKTTSMPAETLCSQAILAISMPRRRR